MDFRQHLYCPECGNKCGEFFHESKDNKHLLKTITGCLRSGKIPNVRLQYFRDALNDSKTQRLLASTSNHFLAANSFSQLK